MDGIKTNQTGPKEPNWFKVFIMYVVTEPFREMKEFFKEVPSLLNRPTIMFWTVLIIAIIEIALKNDKTANFILFGLLVYTFLLKKWKSGEFKHWYREKIKKKQELPQLR